MSQSPKTFELEMPAYAFGDLAWCKLQDLMDGDLSRRESIETYAVEMAEYMLKFKRAIMEKSDFVLIRLRYEKSE